MSSLQPCPHEGQYGDKEWWPPLNVPALDFRLTLIPSPHTADGNLVTLAHWMTGEEIARAETPSWNPDAFFERYLTPLQNYPAAPLAEELLKELGCALAEQLLPDAVRIPLFACMLQANNYAPVRLRLHTSDAVLAQAPWEYIYLKNPPPGMESGDFLCRMNRFHLVRQASLSQPARIEPVDGQLRVLVAWANPRTSEHGYLAHLNAEVKSVLSALSSPFCWNVTVRELQRATRGSLEETLREWSPHVLHFTGHGDSLSGGALFLHEDPGGAGASVNGTDLARWLSRTSTRLVVLSACETIGVAHTLSQQGVAAVISMQLPLQDTAAEPFARHFYSKLAQPASVEEALWWARQGMASPSSPDWGAPVLCLAGNHSDLFRATPRRVETNITRIPNRRFTGRESLLAQIQQAFSTGAESRVALVGMGGAGKTELAVQYALGHMQEYPEGVFWIDARTLSSLQQSCAQIGREYLNVSSKLSTEEQAAQARRHLQTLSRPALLICDDVSEDVALDLLPVNSGCHILFTTREWFIKQIAYTIEAPLLEEQAAVDLLLSYRAGQEAEERVAAQAIAARLGRLPLALTLIAAYVDQCDISYTDYYAEHYAVHPQPSYPKSIRLDLLDIIGRSHRRLTARALSILALAAHFAGQGIPAALLHEAYCHAYEPISRAEFQEAVGSLAGYSLLAREDLLPGERARRLSLHDIIGGFARELLSPAERENVLRSIAHVLTAHLKQANEKMEWRSIRREIRHCDAIAEEYHAGDYRQREDFENLLVALGDFYYEHSDFQTAASFFMEALDGIRAIHGEEDTRLALLFLKMAQTMQRLYDNETGDMAENGGRALEFARKAYAVADAMLLPEDPVMAEYCNTLGYVLKMQERKEEALPYYQRALSLCKKAAAHNGDAHPSLRAEVARCQNHIGMLLLAQNKPEEALQCLEEAVAIDTEVWGSGHVKVAIRLNNVGVAALTLGRFTQARDCHRKALDIYDTAYGRPNADVAASLYYLACAHEALRQDQEAFEFYTEGLRMFGQCFGSNYYLIPIIEARLSRLQAETGIIAE